MTLGYRIDYLPEQDALTLQCLLVTFDIGNILNCTETTEQSSLFIKFEFSLFAHPFNILAYYNSMFNIVGLAGKCVLPCQID